MIHLLVLFLTLAKPPAKADPASAKPKTKSGISVEAVTLEWLNKPDTAPRAIWKEHVVVHRDDVIMKCDRMEADLTTDNRVERATCDGHVEATKGENYVAGKHADFDNVHGVLIMTGDPHGHEGETKVKGDKITFYVDENRLDVEGHTQMDLPKESMNRDAPDKGAPKDRK